MIRIIANHSLLPLVVVLLRRTAIVAEYCTLTESHSSSFPKVLMSRLRNSRSSWYITSLSWPANIANCLSSLHAALQHRPLQCCSATSCVSQLCKVAFCGKNGNLLQGDARDELGCRRGFSAEIGSVEGRGDHHFRLCNVDLTSHTVSSWYN